MSGTWAPVLSLARASIVQVRVLTVRHFDENEPGPTVGTAFVVDKKLGILLTNRHVISTAPIVAEAVFLNDEQIAIEPLYIDPVHDFGFFKFDPQAVKYFEFGELSLKPSGAKVGVDVRVIGSDAGEKVMVLSGTISRVDRNPPEYEPGSGFVDHNTFYIIAACDTSGGSSGSPVLDKSGSVVALNAGAAVDASSSFFLPVHMASKALSSIRRYLAIGQTNFREQIPRSTLHSVFSYVPIPECKRLGVTKSEEVECRKYLVANNDLLVLTEFVPGGVADKVGLCSGDVLLRVEGKYVNQFIDLELILDKNVGKPVQFEFKRGSKLLTLSIVVGDAYDMHPNEFLEFSNGIVHELGFSTALDYYCPMKSVQIEYAGYAFDKADMQEGTIIVAVDNEKVSNLSDLERILSSKETGQSVLVKHIHISNRFIEQQSVLDIDRKWFKMRRAVRDPQRFWHWTYTDSPTPFSRETTNNKSEILPKLLSFRQLKLGEFSDLEERLFKSLVFVEFRIPYKVDGVENTHFMGTGYICSKEYGLVVTDRNTVISFLGDAYVEIGFTKKIRARVLYMHPWQNFAIIQYNVSELGSIQVEELNFFQPEHERELQPGDELSFVGFSLQHHLIYIPLQKVVILERGTVPTPSVPRFASKNFDQVRFEEPPPRSYGGVYVDEMGKVRCFYSSLSVGEMEAEIYLPILAAPIAQAIDVVVESLRQSVPIPPFFSFACEYRLIPLSDAKYGLRLAKEWVKNLAKAADEDKSGAVKGTRELLKVGSIMAGTPPARSIHVGDVFLAADGEPLVSCAGCERAAHFAGKMQKNVNVTVLRDDEVLDISVEPAKLSVTGTKRIVIFCGIQCQETHDAARMHSYVPPYMIHHGKPGVYVSSISHGSPGEKGGMQPVRWIAEINESPVEDLDELVSVVKQFKNKQIIRVRSFGWQGAEVLTTHDVDLYHWKTTDIYYDNQTQEWNLVEYPSNLV